MVKDNKKMNFDDDDDNEIMESVNKKVKTSYDYNQKDENPDFFSFDNDDNTSKKITNNSYMQVTEDVYMNLMKRGNNMDEFMSNDLKTENIKEFEEWAKKNNYCKTTKEYKKKKNEDEDWNEDCDF